MSSYYCPNCQSIVKDWREFVKNYPDLAAEGEIDKPFECVAFRCGKRWSEEEVLKKGECCGSMSMRLGEKQGGSND